MTDGLPVSTWLLGERGSQGSELSQKGVRVVLFGVEGIRELQTGNAGF